MSLKAISLGKRLEAYCTRKLGALISPTIVFHMTFQIASIFETIAAHWTIV